MKTYKQCLPCFQRQTVDICEMSKLGPLDTEAVLDAVQRMLSTFPLQYPPIKMAVEIHDLVRKESGVADPYAEIKAMANDACGSCRSLLAESMSVSTNSFRTAMQLAIAGNIIDCGAYGLREVSELKITGIVQEALAQPLVGGTVESFMDLVENSKSILYVGDNAGECFFDRPLLELLPAGKLTYAVRGGPVLNDATTADAYAAGIHSICKVIDTGDNAPGILLDRCSDDFVHIFESSDLIISKGQGNYESLSDTTDKTIVFLTKVKCQIIAEDIGYSLNSHVIKISRPVTDVNMKTEVNHA